MKSVFQTLTELVPEHLRLPGNMTRMAMLYQVLLDTVSDEDRLAVLRDILAYEASEAQAVPYMEEYYSVPGPDKLLNLYSAYSEFAARTRFRTKEFSKAAEYQLGIFQSILDNGVFPPALMEAESSRISETLLDLSYASGGSENMSLRLYHFTR